MCRHRLLVAAWFLCAGVFLFRCLELAAAPAACDQKCRSTKQYQLIDTGKCGFVDVAECKYCNAATNGACDQTQPGNNNDCIVVTGMQKLYTCTDCTPCAAIPVGAIYDQCDCTKGILVDTSTTYTKCQ